MLDMIHPHSAITAREIMTAMIMADDRFQTTANMADAVILAEALENERHWFVNPNYLLDVWQETQKP